MDKSAFKKGLTRNQFENLISGDWVERANGRFRQNGDFKTAVEGGWKLFQGKNFTIRGRTWVEIARTLKLGDFAQ